MLKSVTAEFPFPGSLALYEDALWKVHRHNGDGTVQIYRDHTQAASGHRSVALGDLTDPGARIARREDAPLAVRLARQLKDVDSVRLVDAIDHALLIRAEHRLDIGVTPSRVAAILSDLGWRRAAGEGPVLFLRGETTLGALPGARRRRAA